MEISPIIDLGNGDALGYYAKGHQDPALFLEDLTDSYGPHEFKPSEVRHAYFRAVPIKSSEANFRLDQVSKGRGAFPVTSVDERPWGNKGAT